MITLVSITAPKKYSYEVGMEKYFFNFFFFKKNKDRVKTCYKNITERYPTFSTQFPPMFTFYVNMTQYQSQETETVCTYSSLLLVWQWRGFL